MPISVYVRISKWYNQIWYSSECVVIDALCSQLFFVVDGYFVVHGWIIICTYVYLFSTTQQTRT